MRFVYAVSEGILYIVAVIFALFAILDIEATARYIAVDAIIAILAVFVALFFRRRRHALPDPHVAHPRTPRPPAR